MNDKEKLLEKIIDNKITPLCRLANVTVDQHEESISLNVDEEATPSVIAEERNYSLIETINIEENYKYLLEIYLMGYGFDANYLMGLEGSNGLLTSVDGENEISYSINTINNKKTEITLKGSVYGDISHMRECCPFKVELGIIGIRKEKSKSLKLYQELLIEGFILEKENNYKMAFFTYFTAIESFVTLVLTKVKAQIYKERPLHESPLLD